MSVPLHVPTGSAGLWWCALGDRDRDLADVGVVLTREKLTEVRAHNTELQRAELRARRGAAAKKSAATTARRRAGGWP